jgi:Uma2 family endonuclease
MSVGVPFTPSGAGLPGPVPEGPIWRFTVEQYHEMIRTGILTEDAAVELLEGWLVKKMPKNPRHRAATRLVQKALERITPAGWYVDTQEPITLSGSEPEPDAAIIRGETNNYLDRHPGPQDVALVVEVADTTLDRDRGSKKRVYAAAGIPTYWIVNLIDDCLEVYAEPAGSADPPDYRHRQVCAMDSQAILVIAGQAVGHLAVRDILPR